MMTKGERIAALVQLPDIIGNESEQEFVFQNAWQKNNFFIPRFSKQALNGILSWHNQSILQSWLEYVIEPRKPKNIGLILAGNIPFVGWHDLISVFACGHLSYFKASASDEVLINWLVEGLARANPKSSLYFKKVERLNKIDGLIATGSTSTIANFNYYFNSVPRLLRGSKTSLGLIYGFENEEELNPLADDLMTYFGMGCRNVTKLLVPEDYDFSNLFQALERYRFLTDHHKYVNNCIYHKSIFLMNGDSFLESDIVTIRPHESIYSPVGVINYQVYSSLNEARNIVESHQKDIQCMVSHQGQFAGSIPFGTAQKPAINDYADGVNTLEFLSALS